MFKDYNIFYKEITSDKIIKFAYEAKKLEVPDFVAKVNNLKTCLATFKRHNGVILDFEANDLFLVDFNTFFVQDLNKNIANFLDITEKIDYLFSSYSAPFCKDCEQNVTKFNKEIFKSIISAYKSESTMLIISFKLNNETFETLEKLGIRKIILNNEILELNSNEFNIDKSSYAIYKTQKISEKFLNDENKVNNIFNAFNDLVDKEIKLFVQNNETKSIEQLIDFKQNEFICQKCFKKFEIFNKENKDCEYTYCDIKYSDFYYLKLDKLLPLLKEKLCSQVFAGREILLAIYDRLNILSKVYEKNINLRVILKDLRFFDIFKIVLSVIAEVLPKNITLVLKDVLDCFGENEQVNIVKTLNANFNKYVILSKNNELNNNSMQIFNDCEGEFGKLKEKIELKKIKYVGEYNNLYKKIVNLFMSSYDVSISNLKEQDFSIAKFKMFLDGKINGDAFISYKVLGFTLLEIFNTNIADLREIFKSFKNVSDILQSLCELGLGNEYLLTKSTSSLEFIKAL